MSRLLKMGITAGMKSLHEAGIACPDGIITGTGHGSVVDMEHFLHDMINMDEETLNPTYFIQSTYNSVNGWLAMQSKCTGYNQTFVHRSFSLELALLDAQMLLSEAIHTQHYLVGSFDEITEEYFLVRGKAGYWKKEAVNSLQLLNNNATRGTIAGEGTAFFTVSNDASNAICIIKEIMMIQPAESTDLDDAINRILINSGLTAVDIDILLCGINGNSEDNTLYDSVINNFHNHTTVCGFKNLCGNFDTASGFALWLITYLYKQTQLPPEIVISSGTEKRIKHILYVNHSIYNNVTLILTAAIA